MTPLRVAVVEDEDPQRGQLAAWLAQEPDVELDGEAADGSAAVQMIDERKPDVVLLDISLPELSGFDVLATIRHTPEIVFTTAARDHAIRAFELGAADYLLKPFGRERLSAALRRVAERVRNRVTEHAGSERDDSMALRERVASVRDEAQPLARLFVRERDVIVPVPVESIVRLEADGDYTAVITTGRRHLIDVPLHVLHARIGRPDFVRVHRQHVVNLAHVARFVAYDASRLKIELTGGGSVLASRAGSQMLRTLVG